MSDIEWTDETWNPTVGCMKVSAGCERCYAITTAYRLEHAFKQPAYQGTTRKLPDGSMNWTGLVRTLPERLQLPLSWTKPRRIFVDSMSDLFHQDVPDEFIDAVWATMALSPQHTYQILTKRPERMLAYLRRPELYDRVLQEAAKIRAARPDLIRIGIGNPATSVLRNAWLGVSVEDQRAADERIPLLLETPAAVRFLSCEPLLGPVDLSRAFDLWCGACHPGNGDTVPAFCIEAYAKGKFDPVKLRFDHSLPDHSACREPIIDYVDWVIVGGESGSKHRPMDLDWARQIRDVCRLAGKPFHFKQVGGRTHAEGGRLLDGRTHDEFPHVR